MTLIRCAAVLAVVAMAGVPAAALAGQAQPSNEAAARAGSNAGSSSMTPTHAPAPPRKKAVLMSKRHRTKAAASHRLSPTTSGMGSQGADATGPISNSH